jgi:hypothetical protein
MWKRRDGPGDMIVQYIREHGNKGVFTNQNSASKENFDLAATEIARLVIDGNCYKTKFYRQAYTTVPNNLHEVPIEGAAICAQNFSS